MNDRELLEAAAKAAGINVLDGFQAERDAAGHGNVGLWTASTTCWNPLTDDGQALRLAVALSLTVAARHHECEVFDDEGECLSSEPIFSASVFVSPAQATDPNAATRRAIVTAAAGWEVRKPHNDKAHRLP